MRVEGRTVFGADIDYNANFGARQKDAFSEQRRGEFVAIVFAENRRWGDASGVGGFVESRSPVNPPRITTNGKLWPALLLSQALYKMEAQRLNME